jgi:hypothetical protein
LPDQYLGEYEPDDNGVIDQSGESTLTSEWIKLSTKGKKLNVHWKMYSADDMRGTSYTGVSNVNTAVVDGQYILTFQREGAVYTCKFLDGILLVNYSDQDGSYSARLVKKVKQIHFKTFSKDLSAAIKSKGAKLQEIIPLTVSGCDGSSDRFPMTRQAFIDEISQKPKFEVDHKYKTITVWLYEGHVNYTLSFKEAAGSYEVLCVEYGYNPGM